MTDILFNVNAKNVRLHAFLPKHGKADDAVRTAELQFRNAAILPLAAAALLLGESGGLEVENAFFVGDPPTQRFFGIGEISCTADFKGRHKMTLDGMTLRCTLVEKIVLRMEGGPQRLIWCDFSVHIEDPDAEEVFAFHELLNRDVELRLDQSADLVDEMRAHARGMAVSDKTPPNGELDLDADGAAAKAQADAIGDTLEQQDAAAAKKTAKRAPRARAA